MMLNFAAFDNLTALVTAFKLSLLALVPYVIVHVVLDKLDSAVEQAFDQSIGTCFIEMLLQIFSDDLWAGIVIWAL